MSQYFGHVVLFVRSFDRCVEFYEDALEMKVLHEHSGNGHPDWKLLGRDGFRLAFHAGHEGPSWQVGDSLTAPSAECHRSYRPRDL